MKWTANRNVILAQLSKLRPDATDTQGLLAPFNSNQFGSLRVEDTVPTNVYGAVLFTAFDDPAVNVAAVAVQVAGGANVTNVCRTISAFLSAGATASGIVKVFLRDGATGVGPILWAGNLAVPIGLSAHIVLTGLQYESSPDTELTLEFSAAGGADTQQTVSMSGYIADES